MTQTSAISDRLYSGILLDLQASEYERAFASLQRLRSEYAGRLVSVADRRQVEASLLADLLQASIPNQLRPNDSLTGEEETEPFSLWRRYLNRTNSTDELLALGDYHWQQGDMNIAQQAWRLAERFTKAQLLSKLEEQPVNDSLRLELLKRKIVAAIFTGKFRTAYRSLQLLHETFPQAQGEVAGQTGELYEILSRLAESMEYAEREEFLQTQAPLPNEKVRFDLFKKCWSVDVHTNSIDHNRLKPLVWKNVLLLQDRSGVRALDLKTGKSAWPFGEEDAGYIFETKPVNESGADFPFVVGGGVLYEQTWIGRTGVASLAPGRALDDSQMSRVTALELLSEGRLQWTLTPDDLAAQGSDEKRIFSGNPVVSNSRVYVPMRSAAPANQLQLLCLNANDGTEIWVRDIAASLKVHRVPAESDNDLLIIDGETLYWLADGLAVCCINSQDGSLNWVSAVEPINGGVQAVSSRNGEGQIAGDNLYVTTVNGVAAMDKYTGEVLWEQYISPPPQAIAGVVDDLVLLTSPGIYAIDSQTGSLSWSHRDIDSQSEHQRGTLSGRSLFWPTSAGVFTVDALSGKIVHRGIPPSAGLGSLLVLSLEESLLLAQSGSQIIGFEID